MAVLAQKHKNLLVLCIAILVALVLSQFKPFHDFLVHLGTFGYVGAFIAGMLFTSAFTTPTSFLIFATLSGTMHPVPLALIGGAGAVVGDFLIFRFIRDDLTEELEEIYEKMGGDHLTRILNTKYFHWTLPLLGSLILASPLPDELGISLMGVAKLRTLEFIPISYFSNTIGILLVVMASEIL